MIYFNNGKNPTNLPRVGSIIYKKMLQLNSWGSWMGFYRWPGGIVPGKPWEASGIKLERIL